MAETPTSATTLPGLSVVLSTDADLAADESTDVAIPGLGSDGDQLQGPLERAVLATLGEYAGAGLVKARDAGKVALALDLCRVMAGKRRSNRTSTYSNDARLLSEILDSFVAEESAGDAAVTEAMREWADQVATFLASVPATGS